MNAAQQKELAEQKRGIRATGDRLQGLIRDHRDSLSRFPSMDGVIHRLGVANHDLAGVLTRVYNSDIEKKVEVK
jgi:hypothetical protein